MRRSFGIRTAMLCAVVAVFLLAYLDLRREQARALDDFSAEQSALARSSAATVEARIGAMISDLEDAAGSAAAEDPGRVLHRILDRPGSLCRQAALCRIDGACTNELEAPGGPILPASLRPARAGLLRAMEGGAHLAISAPLPSDDGAGGSSRLRLFAVRGRIMPGGRAAPERPTPGAADVVVVLADADRLFEGAAAIPKGAAPARYLVLDGDGRWIEFGAGGPARTSPSSWRAAATDLDPGLTSLFARMEGGGADAVLLDRRSAAVLGLERRLAVASFAQIRIPGQRNWSMAVVASAMRVRDRARTAAWRLAAATGMAGLIVGLFGVLNARHERREDRLAEALRLAAATSALRERSEKIVEAIPIGVLTLDAAGRVTAVNPYIGERGARTGASLREALPQAGPDDLAALETLVERAREKGLPSERLGLRLRLAGDEPRDIDACAIPLRAPLPDAQTFLVLHDRTELYVLERSLLRAEKLATIGTLAAGVAHEIGTPLGIISGRAEQLLERLPGDEEGAAARKALSSILSQVDKVSTTIRQLLDFARARPVETVAVTPLHALEGAAALLEHRFRRARVELEVEAESGVPTLAADPGQLEQVLVNLLMNACDACRVGGHVQARATFEPHGGGNGDGVRLEISDDGCGIAPEHLPLVLDPFFTTKKRGQGTGLGLTIAASIVRNHGGTLRIESEPGHGTVVHVTLPVASHDLPAATAEAAVAARGTP